MAVLVKGGGGKPEEEKTVTAGTSVIDVTPSSGKSMKKVTVYPTPTEEKTVTPSTSQQIISPSDGKHIAKVIMEAMTSGALSDITVSSAGLITAQVGTSGYLASGTKKTKQLTTQAAKTWTPGTSDQTISSGRYLTGVQTIKGDSDLLPENIRDGIDIFGVLGTMVEGVDLLGIFGCTKIAIDKFTLSSRIRTPSYTIQHSLGEQPTIAILTCASNPSQNDDVCDIFVRNRPSTVKDYWVKGVLETVYSTYQGGVSNKAITLSYVYVTDTSFMISESGYYYESGIEYTFITMA